MTIWIPWPALDWKVSGDGLLTFFGGLLAFVAILAQVRSANENLRKQLDTEQQVRVDRSKEENFALARALLMELDHFYMGYVKTIRIGIQGLPSGKLIPMRRMPSDPFLIYRSCGARIGLLPPDLIVNIVRAYSGAQWLSDRVTDYRDVLSRVKDEGIVNPTAQLAHASLSEFPEIIGGTENVLYVAAEMLCEFLGVTFSAPPLTLAELKPTQQRSV